MLYLTKLLLVLSLERKTKAYYLAFLHEDKPMRSCPAVAQNANTDTKVNNQALQSRNRAFSFWTKLAASVAFGSFLFGSAPALSQSLSDKTLVVAVAVAPPFIEITDDFHKPRGVDVSLIKELQKRTGFKTHQDEMAMMTLDEMVTLGRSGKADIVAGALSATAERSAHYSVTEPYVYNSVCMVTRANDTIDDIKDLQNRTLAIQIGTNVTSIAAQNPGMHLYEVSSTFMTFYAVATGKADALLVDEIIALEYIKSWPNAGLKVAYRLPDTETGIALFFKKDSPISRELQKTYQNMLDDGTVDRIVRNELGAYIDLLTVKN